MYIDIYILFIYIYNYVYIYTYVIYIYIHCFVTPKRVEKSNPIPYIGMDLLLLFCLGYYIIDVRIIPDISFSIYLLQNGAEYAVTGQG